MLKRPSPFRLSIVLVFSLILAVTGSVLTASSGKPRKFSRPSVKGGADLEGYSDHFPITVELIV